MVALALVSASRKKSKISGQANEMYIVIYIQPWVTSMKLGPDIIFAPYVNYLKQMSGKT